MKWCDSGYSGSQQNLAGADTSGFSVPLIVEAFQRQLSQDCRRVTDDSMIVENQMGVKVHMTEGGYTNIKITTPEDLAVAEAILTQYKK